MRFRYTMLLKLVTESAILTYFEGDGVSFEVTIIVKGENEMSKEDMVLELDGRVGKKTPDGKYEFVGYRDLVKTIK